MSSKSPGHNKSSGCNNLCPGDYRQIQSSANPTSPDGDLAAVTRTLSGLSFDGSGMSSRDSGYCVNTSDGASACSSSTTDATEGEGGTLLVLEPKSLRSFTTNDEYLYAMKEDLADWFTCLYKLDINAENFFPFLETGVLLCQHANKVQDFFQQRREQGETLKMGSYYIPNVVVGNVPCKESVKPQTFQARDNVSNFIKWGRQLGIPEVLTFETDDLVLRKNEKNVILCLLEIARVGAKLGMLAPTLVQMEEEIDAELAGEEVKPKAQIKTCDMRSLDEMVRDLVGRCTCPVQFPMVKVGDGKYKIGDSRSLIFVRILRNHVVVRVGGGWDTLENYLNKHDPCQCNYRGHRASSMGPSTTPTKSANTPRRPGQSVSNSSNANATPRSQAGSKVVSPRRMSTPNVSTAAATERNRSSSPKNHPVRSKSPTLIVSRHIQANQRASYSINNKSADCTGSLSSSNDGGVRIPKANQNNQTEVSKSWSQASGLSSRIPTSGARGVYSRTQMSKSPSPCPETRTSRLRSPSPLNSSLTESSQVKSHPKVARAQSSTALLSRAKGHAGGGEVKVGTPRTIKRAAMNSLLTLQE